MAGKSQYWDSVTWMLVWKKKFCIGNRVEDADSFSGKATEGPLWSNAGFSGAEPGSPQVVGLWSAGPAGWALSSPFLPVYNLTFFPVFFTVQLLFCL